MTGLADEYTRQFLEIYSNDFKKPYIQVPYVRSSESDERSKWVQNLVQAKVIIHVQVGTKQFIFAELEVLTEYVLRWGGACQ